jgi:hypothetical protein
MRIGMWLEVVNVWGMPFPEMGPDIAEVVDQNGDHWEMYLAPNGPEVVDRN